MPAKAQAFAAPVTRGAAAVPRRRCGTSELALPILGMGCWAYGGGDYWGAQSQRDVNEIVRFAVEKGCNFFDTAEAYNAGASESALGAALRGIARDRVIIGTKFSPDHAAPKQIVRHCEASLRRLGTDYLDLYMVHWPITAHAIRHFTAAEPPVPSTAEAFAALDGLRRAGKIRYIGVSNFGPEKLTEALATGVPIAVNELPYSLLTRAVELEIMPLCQARGVGVLGYMALLQGVISDHYLALDDLPPIRRRTRHFDSAKNPQARHAMPGAETETSVALAAIRAVARRVGLSTSELALKWTFAQLALTSSLCGARTLADLQANIRAARTPLDPAIVAELNRITEPLLEAMGPGFDYYEHPDNDRTK
jgi:aryl-alcohol dehydrogenase-like predicted oxidoreductase